MKGIRHIGILLTFTLAVISCEREDPSLHPEQEGDRPIVFTAESEWPEISRAAINTSDDIKDVGFRVWGTWNKSTDEADAVYDSKGNVVRMYNNEWTPTYEAVWKEGFYNFAALLHMQFSGTHSSAFTMEEVDGNTNITYENTLKIGFPVTDFNLGTWQLDCMYAFSNEDNSKNNSSTVNLYFDHLFSLLTVNIAFGSTDALPETVVVSLYGIHSTITGPLTVTHKEVITNYGTEDEETVITISDDLKDLLGSKTPSSESAPYKTISYTVSEAADVITPVKDLLVFPEDLSECPLKIKVEYKDEAGNITATKTAEVNSGVWESGKSYAYTLSTN